MPVKQRVQVGDEGGTTLVELMVALAAGLVIFSALTMVIVVTLHGSAQVSARVDANQRARLTLSKIMEQLHSACMMPEVAPVREDSSDTELRFIHQTGSSVAPVPVLSVIKLTGTTLSQSDYGPPTGTAPSWTFPTFPASPLSTRQLMTGVKPISPSNPIFSYFAYSGGSVSTTRLPVPLKTPNPALTVTVHVAFTAAPGSTPVSDPHAATAVQNTATFRLTPPSFNEGSPARPCQ